MKQIKQTTKMPVKNQKRTQKAVIAKAEANNGVPEYPFSVSKLVVIISIALVVLLGVLFYNFRTTGKATQEMPTLEVYNLDVEKFLDVNVENVETSKIKVTTSSKKESEEFSLSFVLNEDGSLSYILNGPDEILVAKEIINEEFGGGDLYVDDDDKADFKVSYAAPYLHVENAQFKELEDVLISLWREKDGKTEKQAANFVFAAAMKASAPPPEKPDETKKAAFEKVILLFNATSSEAPDTPTLAVAWENGTEFSAGELTENRTGESVINEKTGKTAKFITKRLEWTPTIAGANVLAVKGSIGEKKTQKRYVIAAGNVLYELDEKNLPKVIIAKDAKSNAVKIEFNFSDKDLLQPFSLPCGEVELKSGQIRQEMLQKIKRVATYDTAVKQWTESVPSDFEELKANTGYFLERKKEAVGDIIISVTCGSTTTITPPTGFVPTVFSQPNLKEGWNLIGISGYEPVKLDKLTLPPYKKIKLLYAIDNEDSKLIAEVNELQPGRAYWVNVG